MKDSLIFDKVLKELQQILAEGTPFKVFINDKRDGAISIMMDSYDTIGSTSRGSTYSMQLTVELVPDKTKTTGIRRLADDMRNHDLIRSVLDAAKNRTGLGALYSTAVYGVDVYGMVYVWHDGTVSYNAPEDGEVPFSVVQYEITHMEVNTNGC